MIEIHFSKKHKDIFYNMGVLAIYLFGSRAKDASHPLSDIDIGVVFDSPELHAKKQDEAHQTLYAIFTDVLPKEYLKKRFSLKEHEFDIVFLRSAPLSLQFHAVTEGSILYERDQKKRLNYQEFVIKRYLDMQHVYRLHSQLILQRI